MTKEDNEGFGSQNKDQEMESRVRMDKLFEQNDAGVDLSKWEIHWWPTAKETLSVQ